jgi:ATP-dependent protease Clp ATPase subunit
MITKLVDLQKEIKKLVIGQEKGCDEIAASLFKFLIQEHGRDFGYSKLSAHTLLLVGETGVGKTYTVRELCKLMSIKLLEINAKSICQEGWAGKSFKDLVAEAANLHPNLSGGVIFVDEFDKLVVPNMTSGDDNANYHNQCTLLKYIEDTVIHFNPTLSDISRNRAICSKPIDTSKFMFIFAGAFSDLKLIQKRQIGYLDEKKTKLAQIERKEYLDAFIDYGMLPELAGRMKDFIILRKLDVNDYITILKSEHFISEFWGFMLCKLGIKLKFSSNKILEMAENASILNIGVRGLKQIVDDEVTKLMNDNAALVDLEKFSPLYFKN